jgi:RNA polymerase sigma-70 factor, ECF subfamily
VSLERQTIVAGQRAERVKRSQFAELIVLPMLIGAAQGRNIHVKYTGPDGFGMLRYNLPVLAGGSDALSGDAATRTDLALIERVAAHDEEAAGELYDRHHRLLYSLILRIVRDAGEAEDVLQETFVALWTRVQTYDAAIGSPIAWLVRIARNRAIDRVRASDVRIRAAQAAPLEPVPPLSPEDAATLSEEGRLVVNALAALPAEQRALIEDAYFLGLTHVELADRHGLPLGTVKTRIRNGMQSLRATLARSIERTG